MSQKSKMNSVQITWLNTLRKAGRPVTIFLSSGECLPHVVLTHFDLYALHIRVGKNTRLVCKTHISSVAPEPHPARAKKRRADTTNAEISINPANHPAVTVKRRRLVQTEDRASLTPAS